MTKPYIVIVSHFERILVDDIIYGFSLDQVLSSISEKCKTLYRERPLNVVVEDYNGLHLKDSTLT